MSRTNSSPYKPNKYVSFLDKKGANWRTFVGIGAALLGSACLAADCIRASQQMSSDTRSSQRRITENGLYWMLYLKGSFSQVLPEVITAMTAVKVGSLVTGIDEEIDDPAQEMSNREFLHILAGLSVTAGLMGFAHLALQRK